MFYLECLMHSTDKAGVALVHCYPYTVKYEGPKS